MTTGSPATVWQGPAGTVPVVNGNGNIFEEVQVATAAQTVFNLLTFQYTPGTHSIFVYRKSGGIGAQMLRRGVDYTETDNDTITLAAGATAGDLLVFVAIAINQLLTPPIANGMPAGGTAGQVLDKIDGSDYNVKWVSFSALGSLLDSPRVNVASAATVDLTGQATVTRNIQITGTVEIDGFQIANGELFAINFQSPLLLKNNAAIITQAGADIQVSAGDTCFIRAIADNIVAVLAFSKASAGLVDPVNDFRLTLTAGTPVTTADVVAAGTIYCTPYKGNKIALYNGGSWKLYQSAEFSTVLAALTVARPYDIFCFDNAGVPTLELLAWTNNTVRATALVRQDGVLVKSGDPTRRYLGTFHTTAAATTEDSARRRLLWNYYHRVARQLFRSDPAASWTYTLGVFRQANANVLNQIEAVVGVSEDMLDLFVAANASNSNATAIPVNAAVGIGLNSTTVNSSPLRNYSGCTVTNVNVMVTAKYQLPAPLGYNFFTWLEVSDTTGVTQWLGQTASGIAGTVFA